MDNAAHRKAVDYVCSDKLKDKAVVFVTHQMAGPERFDQVVRIEDGRVTEQGGPAELGYCSVE